MKLTFFMVFLIFNIHTVAQFWATVGEPFSSTVRKLYSHDDKLWAGGSFKFYGDSIVGGLISFDENFYFTAYGCVGSCNIIGLGGYIMNPFTIFQDTLYMQGGSTGTTTYLINEIAGTKGLAILSNGVIMPSPHGITNGNLACTEVIGDTLYICGIADTIAGVHCQNCIKHYNDVWESFDTPPSADVEGFYQTMCLFQGQTIMAGNFDPGGTMNDIMAWNGQTWQDVGGGLSSHSFGGIYDVIPFQNELYACGVIQRNMGDPGQGIVKWNGTEWTDVGFSCSSSSDYINEMIVWNDELYVCGSFDSIGNIFANNVAKWDGHSWCGLGHDFTNWLGCQTLAVFNEELYTVHYVADEGVRLFRWDGIEGECSIDFNSVAQQNIILSIQLYPNPTTSELTISCGESNIISADVFDLLGKQIHSISANSRQVCLATSGLAKGCYMIQVELDNGQIIVKKLMKE